MNKLRKDAGSASVILLLFSFIFFVIAIIFTLDVMGYIEVPKEYSLTRFLDEAYDTNYSDDEGNGHRVIKKIKDKVYNGEYEEIEVTKPSKDQSDDNIDNDIEDEVPFNDFYYNQLEDYGKNIYNKIIDNLDNLKTGTYTIDFGKDFNKLLNSDGGEEKLNNCFQSAVNAVLLDHPEIFYVDITKMYLYTKSTTFAFTGTTYEVSIGPEENNDYLLEGFTKYNIEEAEDMISDIRRRVINRLDSDNPIERLKEVHDYLVDKLEYDSTFKENNIYNIYGALVNNVTVCEGYAKAFKYLLTELKIPCVVICGDATNSEGNVENHAWNYVLVDGSWYAIDVTWDDPIIKGGGVLKKENKYKYFLKGANTLFQDHREDGEIVKGANFAYPNLSKEDY